MRSTSTPRPRGLLCGLCVKNLLLIYNLFAFSALSGYSAVKFFVIVCLYFVCSHRLRRATMFENCVIKTNFYKRKNLKCFLCVRRLPRDLGASFATLAVKIIFLVLVFVLCALWVLCGKILCYCLSLFCL